MDNTHPSANESHPDLGLNEPLRSAVEQVRQSVPPADAVERSLDRAQRLGPPLRRRSRRWLVYSAAASIAAVLLIGYGVWHERKQEQPRQLALHKIDAKQFSQQDVNGTTTPAAEDEPFALNLNKNTRHYRDRGAKQMGGERAELFERMKQEGKPSEPGLLSPDKMPPAPPTGATGPGGGQGGPSSVSTATTNGPEITSTSARSPGRGGTGGGSGDGKGAGSGGRPAQRLAPLEEMEYERAHAPDPAQLRQLSSREMNRAKDNLQPGYLQRAASADEAKGMYYRNNKDASPARRAYDDKDAKGGEKPQDEKKPMSGEQLTELRKARLEHEKAALELDKLKKSNEGGAVAVKKLKAAETKVKETESFMLKLEGQQGQNGKGKELTAGLPKKNEPKVWHRDRSRPTFARVYLGDNNALELVSLHVNVIIEGPRARTVVDHIFRNPHDRQLEGTFEYPLPSGASPSYFAMFLGQTRDTMPVRFGRRGDNAPLPDVALARLTPAELVKQVDTTDWGRLQEARIVSKEKALETYEEVVRGRIDPALLEYAGGNTFSGRVFPIPPKGYNRVILAYEETLPVANEQMLYRFPLPNSKLHDLQFNLQAKTEECLKPSIQPKDATKDESAGRFTFSRSWKNTAPEGEVVFACTPAQPDVQAISGRQGDNGPRYVYARLRPQLKTVAKKQAYASRAVFLLDTSLSEHPERFDINVQLLQKILESDSDIKQFNVLTFNVGAAWLKSGGFFENTKAGRAKALKQLDGLVLEGATDISCALERLAAPGFDLEAGTNLDVFLLSDGHITWGEPDVTALVARFEQRCPYPARFHCYRTGLGEENSELFEALTRKGGGVFQCYNETELASAAGAHRSQCLLVKNVRFVGGPEASDILVAGRRAAVYPGGELVVAARFNGTGRTTVLVEGEFAGQKMVQEFPLEVKSASELAPRAWAEVAVSSLLALHESNLDGLVAAYCQQFGIVSRVASFLVLENEADYKRFNLEEERGKTVAGDLGEFLDKMWMTLGKVVPAGKEFTRFLEQVDKRINLLNGQQGAHVKQMLAALKDDEFELPVTTIGGGLLHQKDVAGYLAEREADRREVGPYLKEARRRAEAGDVDGAVRVLSSIIEEYPSRGDALRLVGYRLLDLEQPAQAARLFRQVQKQRPFEPHSYRDLAHALEKCGRLGLAAINYEIVLAGNWHNRFRQDLTNVAQEEYARMMQDAIRHQRVKGSLANLFGERLEQMARPQPKSDLRVTISWNTDATDIDLWVIEPDGTKCYYQNNRTPKGGELSQDQTQGYGPERYQIAKAQPGVYTVLVHYFGINQNLLGGETHVSVTVTRFAGTPQEKTERHTVILKKHNEQVEVCKVKF